MKYRSLAGFVCIIFLAGCADNGSLVEDFISPSTADVAEISECGDKNYYSSLSGEQVYDYEYDTENSTRVAEIPELCMRLSIEDRESEYDYINELHEAYREAGVLRNGGQLEQNPLTQEMKILLEDKYDGVELYLDDAISALIDVISIPNEEHQADIIKQWWLTNDPANDCNTVQSRLANWSVFVDTQDLYEYYHNEDDPSRMCPHIFMYKNEQRAVVPRIYPEGVYAFFAPRIEFLDRD